MSKKILAIALTLIFCVTGITACAANNDLTIKLQINNPVMTVNGEEKPIDEQGTAPVIINDRTLLPVRAVVEEIGGKVAWDSETQTVTITTIPSRVTIIPDAMSFSLAPRSPHLTASAITRFSLQRFAIWYA